MQTILTCPNCEGKTTLKIPKNSCLNSYVCKKCKGVIFAKESCCVFCDYGDKKCPVSKEAHM
ncbi:MAG: GDCCVxC domain-containing (seleno)protein [Nanoarchaeota archaeon]